VRSLPLGTTGLEVTRVIAGAARAPVPVRRGVDSLGEAWDLGVRALDVSDLGAPTETAAERFLEDRQPEDAVILAGIGGTARPDRGSDLSPERLERSLAAAVRRLGRLDLAWLGGSDAETPLEATLTALAAALDAGRMRGWGAGDADVWRLDELLTAADRTGLPRPGFVRIRLNLLERGGERDLLGLAAGEGVGVLARTPLAAGRLTDAHVAAEEAAEVAARAGTPRGAPADPALAALLDLRGFARDRSVSTAALALAWLAGNPGVSATIVAARSPAEWETVHEALEADLDEELRDRLDERFR
jgi:aryl-alcohol dehydrogenase-like predicted oxidoreductase